MLRQQRPRQKRFVSVVLAICAVVTLGGCASSQHTPNGGTSAGGAGFVKSGFLSDYSRLQPSENPELPTAFIYRNTEKNLSIYRIVMLERVAVRLRPGAYAAKVHPKELESLAGFFEDEIKHSLGDLHLWAVLVRDSLDEAKGLHRGSVVHSTGNTFR